MSWMFENWHQTVDIQHITVVCVKRQSLMHGLCEEMLDSVLVERASVALDSVNLQQKIGRLIQTFSNDLVTLL